MFLKVASKRNFGKCFKNFFFFMKLKVYWSGETHLPLD